MKKYKETIVGNPVIVVVDINESAFWDYDDCEDEEVGIPIMDGLKENMENAAKVVQAGRDVGIPIVFIHEVHRQSGIDFGRELDGAEDVHCVEEEGHPDLPRENLKMTEADPVVFKRRYSAFFGTDLEIVLNHYKAETLILVGMLTDVCIHFTFVDAHQKDYYCRTISDACCGSSIEAHNAAFNSMNYLQGNSVVSTIKIIEVFKDYGKSNK